MPPTKVREELDRVGRAIMATETASPDDYMDIDATDLPTWSSPPSNVSAQETGGGTDVIHSTASPQDTPQHSTTASTVRALNDDDPPFPLMHVVDHENETEGPQLHDGPSGPPSFPSELDDSRTKKVENDFERQLPQDNEDAAPTVRSTVEASATNAAAAVGNPWQEVNVISQGTAPPAATAAVGRNASPAGCSTSKPPAVLPFYQRKSFVSDMKCTLFVIGIAVTIGVLISNIQEPTSMYIPTKTPTSSPTSHVSRRKKSRATILLSRLITFWFILDYFRPQRSILICPRSLL